MNKDDFINEIYFSKEEIDHYEKKFNLPQKFAVIHSEAKQSLTSNKNWGLIESKMFNSINSVKWIQVGRKGEYEIKNTYKNILNTNLRELGFILSKCDF